METDPLITSAWYYSEKVVDFVNTSFEIPPPKCCCDIKLLFDEGCQCGRAKLEIEVEKRKRKKKS